MSILCTGWTLAAGVLGGGVFWYFHLPAPWLSGGMVGVLVILVFGIQARMSDALRDFGMLMAGAVTGSAITPEMVRAAGKYPGSLLILAITTLAVVVAGRLVLMRAFGWDRQSATLAAVPGALSAVIAMAADLGGDMKRIVAVQSFRMFVLVALLPSTVVLAVSESVPLPAAALPGPAFALMMLAALVTAFVFQRLRIMAPFLLGGMAAAGLLHVTGAIAGAPPQLISGLAMLIVGVFAGSRFSGLDRVTIRSLFLPGLAILFVTTGIAVIGGIAAARLIGVPIAEALVAYAPGGLEAMVMLGLAMGLDPLYVSSHHVARFVMIAVALPLFSRVLR